MQFIVRSILPGIIISSVMFFLFTTDNSPGKDSAAKEQTIKNARIQSNKSNDIHSQFYTNSEQIHKRLRQLENFINTQENEKDNTDTIEEISQYNFRTLKDKEELGSEFKEYLDKIEQILSNPPLNIGELDNIIEETEGTYVAACARLIKCQELLRNRKFKEIIKEFDSQENLSVYFDADYKGASIENGVYLLKGLAHAQLNNKKEATSYFDYIIQEGKQSGENQHIVKKARLVRNILITAEKTKKSMKKEGEKLWN